jgi:hypothetical protein
VRRKTGRENGGTLPARNRDAIGDVAGENKD